RRHVRRILSRARRTRALRRGADREHVHGVALRLSRGDPRDRRTCARGPADWPLLIRQRLLRGALRRNDSRGRRQPPRDALARRTLIDVPTYERMLRAAEQGGDPPADFTGDFVFRGVRNDRRVYESAREVLAA